MAHFEHCDIMTSSVWRHRDPWRHWSRDHSKQHMWLPIGHQLC